MKARKKQAETRSTLLMNGTLVNKKAPRQNREALENTF